MPKWAKLLVAILLLPACAGAAMALVKVVRASSGADTVWILLAAGACCWLSIYLLLPKPMLMYVYGHELTHVIWTWAAGGRVKRFKASSKGGHVIVTKSNFLTVLAPYFFPLYAVLLIFAHKIVSLFVDPGPWRIGYLLLLGAAYGFHLTLTWHALQTEQSDVSSQGYLFSAVVIFLGNIVLLLVAVPLLTSKVSILTAFHWWWQSIVELAQRAALVRVRWFVGL
jgi:hypothetical protein